MKKYILKIFAKMLIKKFQKNWKIVDPHTIGNFLKNTILKVRQILPYPSIWKTGKC